ncbi:MAG: PH domain-containing protein, partial [Bacteroidales bacterium]|nr:PH domain-containing protein [Bacteroidales bacterium]
WCWYLNLERGKFFVYANRLDQLVLVKLKSGRKYVLSCENADKMADAINHYLQQVKNQAL